ncbi:MULTISPECIES: phosphopantetheine-binding protein [unclassified Streptomyces]|uniref:phosphopantetheine-binding protein n=1 Tax=unclassified Streptomyces TaxID=2593676 RepID=UPI002E3502CD|nr:phosphopantetheine-binding protein [Streptomyces sp. NBC_01268]
MSAPTRDIAGEIRAHLLTQYLKGEDITAEDLPGDYELIESGVVDSLGLVKLIQHIANTYGVPIDDIEIGPDNFRTIDAITKTITDNTAL